MSKGQVGVKMNNLSMREAWLIGKLIMACEKHQRKRYRESCECDACRFVIWFQANFHVIEGFTG